MPEQLEESKFERSLFDRLYVLTQEITPKLLDGFVKNASPNGSGDLGYLYEIYYKVRQYDARIGAAIDKRVDNLIHLDYQITAASEDNKEQEAANLVKYIFKRLKFSEFVEDVFDGKLMGASVLELTWKRYGEYMIPNHPYQLPYSRLAQGATAKRGDYGRLFVKEGNVVNPVDYIWVDDLKEDNPNKFVVAYGREKDAYYDVTGIMKPLISLYIVKYYALLFWMQYAEKYGEPFMVGKLPDRLFKEYKSQMEKILKNAGRDRYAVVLEDMQMEAINTSGSPDMYKQLIDYVDTSSVIKILGSNLTSEVSGGSFAAADVHQSGEMRKLVGDSNWTAEIINDQLIPYIMNVNFPEMDEEQYPTFEFSLPQNVDEFQEIRKLGEASRYVPVPVAEFYSKGGIRQPTKDDSGEVDEEVVSGKSSVDQILNTQ